MSIMVIGDGGSGKEIARALYGLGLTPSASRRVKPIPAALLGLVPKPTDKNTTVLSSDPDVVSETMPTIMSKVQRTLYQTKKLAAAIKGNTLADTLKNDSRFVLDYIKYELDDSANEEIRSPRRTVHDAKGDCDCMATLLASMLTNQGIKFNLRIAKYKNGSDWSHIYIVVPKDQNNKSALNNRGDYFVLDPVTNKHDYEVPPKEFKDFTMGLKYLDGIGSGAGNLGCSCDDKGKACDTKPLIKRLRYFVPSEHVVAQGMVPTRVFLCDNNIAFEEKTDKQNDRGYFVVQSPSGPLRVSTIITPTEANTLKTLCVRTKPIEPSREEKLIELHRRTMSVRLNDNAGILPKSDNFILSSPLGTDKNILITTAEGVNTNNAVLIKQIAPVEQTAVATTNNTTAVATPAAVKEGYNWFGLMASAGIALITMPKSGGAVAGLSGLPVARKKRAAVPVMKM